MTTPTPTVKDEEKAARRAEQLRRSQENRRLRLRAAGVKKIELLFTTAELAELIRLRDADKGNPETFFKRALLVGAKFSANAGQGKKPARCRAAKGES